MRLLLITIFSAFFLFAGLQAAGFDKQVKEGQIIQEGKSKGWCSVCGMNLKMYYRTNHAVELKDGTKKQYCSIRCLAHDYPHIKSNIKHIYAVDAKTAKLIDATKAHYVLGSKAPGTMTRNSKMAFADANDAKAFAKQYHGKKIVGFNEAFKQAQSDLEADNRMLMGKKEKMVYPKGKMIREKMCAKTIDADNFETIADLKAEIKAKHLCKNLDEKQLQVVSVYLWDKERQHAHVHNHQADTQRLGRAIEVPKTAKCPVCGMFVFKYPRWAAKMIMANADEYYFDGAKDMFKFYLQKKNSSEGMGLILVTDYYTQNALQARSAFYVVGSDVYGPMGNELIPFSTMKDAKTFAKDHRGDKILTFDEVTMPLLESLDE